MKPILTIGEILVEIMAERRGQSLGEVGGFVGPYPSGAPAIFIDQVARAGHPAAMIAAVGDDAFGHMCLERLAEDGVDVSGVAIVRDRPTGHAFVAYRDDGGRDFIFNIAHSAAGTVGLTPTAERLIAECGHLHVMGSSLGGAGLPGLIREAVSRVKASGGAVSFDPNIRPEILNGEAYELLRWVLERTDLFMPSREELSILTDAKDEDDAIAELLARGVGGILLKLGAGGARYVDRGLDLSAPAFEVDEIDPTGAGDCFGGAFVACRGLGMPVDRALLYANAAGALAAATRGPMEGAADLDELSAFMAVTPRRID